MTKHSLTNVSSKYGAPMGRAGMSPKALAGAFSLHADKNARMYLARVRLDSGGYDSGGAYWGIPSNLWHASFTDADGEECESFFRAGDRAEAKAMLPGARFSR